MKHEPPSKWVVETGQWADGKDEEMTDDQLKAMLEHLLQAVKLKESLCYCPGCESYQIHNPNTWRNTPGRKGVLYVCSRCVATADYMREHRKYERFHIEDDKTRDILIKDENNLVVATMPWGNDKATDNEQKSTARMLAAAPRMADLLIIRYRKVENELTADPADAELVRELIHIEEVLREAGIL